MVRVSISSYLQYLNNKADYSFALVLRNFIAERLTFLHWNKGEEMAPTIAGNGATLLVRKLVAHADLKFSIRFGVSKTWPWSFPFERKIHLKRNVFVGDVVVLKNPEEPDKYLVRRLTAIEGYEMVSSNKKEESFVLEKNQCWVVAENEKLKAKEAFDSRTFGPVQMRDIVGRVIYCLQSAVDHSRIQNSDSSVLSDSAVLDMELDVDEMAKSHKA